MLLDNKKNFMESIIKISKEELLSRVKSLLWRIGMMALALIVGFLLDNLEVLNLSPTIIGVLGLVLGEISKTLNSNLTKIKQLASKAK